MELIAQRKNKEIYVDNDKVIKLFVEEHSQSDILNEALNQTRVDEYSNLNVPKLVEVRKLENRWAIVSERVEGKTISQMMKEQPEKTDEYLNLFVDVQLTILSNEVPLLNRIKEKFTRKLENATNKDENTK